jgi:hypothetical protein
MSRKMTYDPTRTTTADEISEILNQEQFDKWIERATKKDSVYRKSAPFSVDHLGPFAFPLFIKSYFVNNGSEWRHCIFDWDHHDLKYVHKGDVWR